MLISELVERLNGIKESKGDIVVEVRNDAGDFYDVVNARAANVAATNERKKYHVFLETF